jgi:hypothetical protein
VLRAKYSAAVVHPPATLAGYTAHNSWRDGIHSTSRCHADPVIPDIATVCGAGQDTPSADRRTSIVVVDAVHPADWIIQLSFSVVTCR